MSTSPTPGVHTPPIRCLVADDHATLRDVLVDLLAAGGVDVVGVASDGPEAIARAGELRPDVALVDVRMPGLSGLEVARRLTDAALPTRVLLVTGESDAGLEQAAADAGARGIVLKGGPLDDLLDAVRAAAR